MYHPFSQLYQYFCNTLDRTLDLYSNYENVLLIGDFNAQIGETHLDTFYINMSQQISVKNQHGTKTQKIQVA